ncbi:MAG: lysophospholipid acyltransferase family protein [Xanthomonadales bacterium]|nr:lysophospholipid acyltransferase family protein [Xanthomonadales bacterium]
MLLCHYRPLKTVQFGGKPLLEVSETVWSRAVCALFGVRLALRGAIGPGPHLVVANHISWLDITAMRSFARMGFVSKAEINDWPVIGYLARIGQTVFHHRGSHDSASGVADVMAKRLREGGNVAIFPEGGILPGAGVKRFHGRLFAAAIDTGSPVQPVMLRYMRDGNHLDDVTFIRGEHFVGNLFRLLRQRTCVAEVAMLPCIESAGKQRRPLAAEAERAVRTAFDAEMPNA